MGIPIQAECFNLSTISPSVVKETTVLTYSYVYLANNQTLIK